MAKKNLRLPIAVCPAVVVVKKFMQSGIQTRLLFNNQPFNCWLNYLSEFFKAFKRYSYCTFKCSKFKYQVVSDCGDLYLSI